MRGSSRYPMRRQKALYVLEKTQNSPSLPSRLPGIQPQPRTADQELWPPTAREGSPQEVQDELFPAPEGQGPTRVLYSVLFWVQAQGKGFRKSGEDKKAELVLDTFWYGPAILN